MNATRRTFVLGGATGLVVLMSGCATRALHENHTYTEAVSSVLITQDKKKIVFIGKEFHYIFDAPPALVNSLELPFHEKISGTLSNFHVNSNGMISGSYSLSLAKDASEKEPTDVLVAGFNSQSSGKLSLQGTIHGTRYVAGSFPSDASYQKLNRTHNITVIAEQSSAEKGAKALLTPITVAADGALVLFAVVLSPLLIPIALSTVCFVCK